jgi:hypothetical protein
MLPRANLTDLDISEGKDVAVIEVRAASKQGAIFTARLEAIQSVPLREQSVHRIESMSNDRFLDKWTVEIKDKESLKAVGQ